MQFAVFGNPISHSKSPFIHQQFAKQFEMNIIYAPVCVELDAFEAHLTQFFKQGGRGANVTLPFKERAYEYCEKLTPRAQRAQAVNTIKWNENGESLGDNTDGMGLVSDLTRLNMLPDNARILIIGAGGAAKGAIEALLSQSCHITLINRTFSRAQQLNDLFHSSNLLVTETPQGPFDLIINATSASVSGQVPLIARELITAQSACYDLFYQAGETAFLRFVKEAGSTHYADGLGMLVGQAAHAFSLWFDCFPEIEPVLTQLRQQLSL